MTWVVWFTGLPGCGKTTIAQHTKALLEDKDIPSKTLQLDEVRKVITPQPRYTEEEREIVYASLAYMAMLLYEAGVNVIVDATANRRKYRDLARDLVPRFAEIFVKAPLEVCMARESVRKAEFSPSGIYRKAREGAAVPGIGVTYEEPPNPEVVVDSSEMSPEQCAELVARRIGELFKE